MSAKLTAVVCVLWVLAVAHAADVWHVRAGVCEDCGDVYVEVGLGG